MTSGNHPSRMILALAGAVVVALVITIFWQGRVALPARPMPVGSRPPVRRVEASPSPGLHEVRATPQAAARKATIASTGLAPTAGATRSATESTGPRWSGRVTSKATGQPIVGAVLAIRRTEGIFGGTGTWGAPLRSTRTADSGAYELAGPEPASGPDEAEGLEVSAAGFESFVALPTGGGGRSEVHDFALRDGGSIWGTTRGPGGGPISGAVVTTLQTDATTPSPGEPAVLSSSRATSGTDGTFEMPNLPAGEKVTLMGAAPGFANVVVEGVAVGARDVVVAFSARGGRIEGIVRYDDGRAVPGAQVSCYPSPGVTRVEVLCGLRAARSDAAGRFSLEGLAAGKYQVMAVLNGSWSSPASAVGDVEEGKRVSVELVLPSPVTIAGRVIEEEGGAGVAGARIRNTPFRSYTGEPENGPTSLVKSEAVSDATGYFEYTAPFPRPEAGSGAAMIFVEPPAPYLLVQGETMRYNHGAISVSIPPKGEKGQVEIRLRKGGAVAGIVLQADGTTPAVDARVIVADQTSPIPQGTRTDQSGKFSATVAGNATFLAIAASHDSGFKHLDVPSFDPTKPGEVRIVLEAYATVSGRVFDAQGSPATGISIQATQLLRTSPGSAFGLGGESPATTGEDGAYVVTRVPPGEVDIAVMLPPDSPIVGPPQIPLTLKPGETRADVDFHLLEGASIDGVVSDENGDPLSGANVFAQDFGAGGGRFARTDEKGYYVLKGVPPEAPFYLGVSKEGYVPQSRQDLVAADGAQNFVLKKSPLVTLVVTDAAGTPVARYSYSLLYRSYNSYYPMQSAVEVSSPDGRASLSTPTSGEWRVEVKATGDSAAPLVGGTNFRLPAPDGGAVELHVVITTGITLTGRVISVPDESPVAGVDLTIRTTGGSNAPASPKAVSAADGSFSFRSLPPGNDEILVSGKGMFTEAPVWVDIPETGAPEPLTIKVRPGSNIRGRVVDAGGAPVPNVKIERTTTQGSRLPDLGSDGQPLPADVRQSDAQGRFEYLGVRGGVTQLAWTSSDGRQGTKKLTVMLGESVETEIVTNGAVPVEGRITVGGKPSTGTPSVYFATRDGDAEAPAPPQADGSYKVMLQPGTHIIMAMTARGGSYWQLDTLEVPPFVESLHHDIAVELISADVVLDDQVPEPAEDARLTLEQRAANGDIRITNLTLNARRRHVNALGPGEWRAVLRQRRADGRDYEEVAASDWTTLAPGAENTLLIRPTVAGQQVYELTLTLPPGTYQYKFNALATEWWEDPLNPMKVQDGQFSNSAFKIPGGAVDGSGVRSDWPRVNDTTGEVTFHTSHKGAPTSVFVSGTFNAWQSNDASRMRLVEAP